MPDPTKTQPDFSREEMIMPKDDSGIRLVPAAKVSKSVSKVFVVTALGLLLVTALIILGALFLPKVDWRQWLAGSSADFVVEEKVPPFMVKTEAPEKNQDLEDLMKYSESTDLEAIATDLAATDFRNILLEVNQIEREIKADLATSASSSDPALHVGDEDEAEEER